MANCKAGRTAEMWGGLTVWEKQEGRQHYISFRNFACLTLLSEMWKQNWAPQWEFSHIMSREASAFSNMKCKCVLKCSPFEKLGWRKIKMFTLPPAAPMIMLSTGRGRHIFLASRPTPRQPAQNHQPPRKYHFHGLERTKSQATSHSNGLSEVPHMSGRPYQTSLSCPKTSFHSLPQSTPWPQTKETSWLLCWKLFVTCTIVVK